MTTTDVVKVPARRDVIGLFRAMSRPSLLAFGVAIVAIIIAISTYAAVRSVQATPLDRSRLIILLLPNVVMVLTLAGLIGWRLVRLWRERRAGQAGARLHGRMVAMFAAVAVVPAIFVAVFAAVTLNFGIEAWFSANVKQALEGAQRGAAEYEKSQETLIQVDGYAIASGIENDPQIFPDNNVDAAMLFTKLATMTKDRGLSAAYILDSKGSVLGSTKSLSSPDLKSPSATDFRDALHGKMIIDANSKLGVVRALLHLRRLNDAYLLVVRPIDPAVLAYYQKTVSAVSEYKQLDSSLSRIKVVFAALYGVIAMLVLLAAIWMGLWAATTLVRPISRLIGAAERVSGGDLKAQVAIERGDDEIGTLGRAFNRMMAQLSAQRSELIDASHQIDIRRRFTEAVLSGVSAGVIGLDGDGKITIVNRAAARLLNAAPEEVEGRHYSEAVPELGALIRKAISEPVGRASGEASVKRGGKTRSLSVQVDSEEGDVGFVVTFDDITDLVSAQRTAAWADVARRIAHEIKNPLTPIQLSAERLKRKYGKEVTTDPEIFEQCTDTIIRQVGDIGRMVDEFSSFARMPAPLMKREHVQELMHQAVFLQRVAHPSIAFESKASPEPVYAECDGRLVSQALTNVLKNATEAIAAREATGDETPGRISIALEKSGTDGNERLTIRVADNGIGLPAEHRHRLTEPYVTTRAKGTGLGLAIVRKIFEDHGGDITLSDLGEDERGAEVRLSFPVKQKPVRDVQETAVKTVQKTGVGV